MKLPLAAKQIGVTRIARLTGLDRIGVEVAGSVRPTGHVLQVCQGKGRTFEQAWKSALGESMELFAAENPEEKTFHWHTGTPAGAIEEGFEARCAWVSGYELTTHTKCMVLAERVYCPPSTGPSLGPTVGHWSSNGMGAHPTSHKKAVKHAVNELIERDTLARVLPEGFHEEVLAPRLIPLTSKLAQLKVRGIHVFLFDLSLHPRRRVTGVLIFDEEDESVPLTAGYACRENLESSAEAAFLEAAQTRLTQIHGAREDVVGSDMEAGLGLLDALKKMKPRKSVSFKKAIALPPIAIVSLGNAPWKVVKAVSPSMRVSELL
jgi:ribosomal protein S12 methylthiotransferase accessory factor